MPAGDEVGVDLGGQVVSGPLVGPGSGVAEVEFDRLVVETFPVPRRGVHRGQNGGQGGEVVLLQRGDRTGPAAFGRGLAGAGQPARQVLADLPAQEVDVFDAIFTVEHIR